MTKDGNPPCKKRGRLRGGFSTGTAAVAAAQAAFRCLTAGCAPESVAVRLPSGIYLAVKINWSRVEGETASASVIKDGGDDPDVTNGAEIRARVRILRGCSVNCTHQERGEGIHLIAGRGVGVVTKAGLPVLPGEPAVNPVPRQMLADNLCRELMNADPAVFCSAGFDLPAGERSVFIPFVPAPDEKLFFRTPAEHSSSPSCYSIVVEIEVPRGEELAVHTLNPRLGIVGGISILGTTGTVKPFSHQAYQETIQAALSVAASNGCGSVILSTGGKSERFAREKLPGEPVEAFIQMADFFAYAVREARRFGFKRIIHSVFFGKAVKMAQGHPYTHAHSIPMELRFLAEIAEKFGYEPDFCLQLAAANTARHALEIMGRESTTGIVRAVAEHAVRQSSRLAGDGIEVRLLLFDFNGNLLADVK
ncbi:MAG: cobalt-precorrin-5B (C(1))-methyltransferase CbiD [Syntrophobacteraceae bacterium]